MQTARWVQQGPENEPTRFVLGPDELFSVTIDHRPAPEFEQVAVQLIDDEIQRLRIGDIFEGTADRCGAREFLEKIGARTKEPRKRADE